MLIELTVQNLLFAKQARIEPGRGLCVISGETGSGKSLLLGALQLVLGGRSSSKLVGPDGPHTLVTAVFEHTAQVHAKINGLAQEHGFQCADDEPVILRRQMSAKGRSQSWINDTPVSVQVLKIVGHMLVDVQGQHEPLRLAERERQMEVIDSFAGCRDEHRAYVSAVHQLRSLEQELSSLSQAESQRLKERDFNKYLLEEIDTLNPEPGEFEQLESQQRILAGAQEWRALAQRGAHVLAESEDAINQQIGRLAQDLAEAPDPRLEEAAGLCEQAESLLRDASMLCLDAGESIEADPEALAQSEERLGLYLELMRKHGGTPDSLLAARDDLSNSVQAMESCEARQAELESEIKNQEQHVFELGKKLAKKRRAAFKKLSKAIRPHLDDLGMPEAQIELHEDQQAQFDVLGTVYQEILVQTNPGIAADRIGAVASGGEHARLALALALVLGDSDDVPVMVFDEIDSGVGARLGVAIGHKLATLAKSRTVMVITHTPQVAAMAQHHYLVRKVQSQDATHMDVRHLEGDERHRELTDMLGGGKAAAQQAQELLALA